MINLWIEHSFFFSEIYRRFTEIMSCLQFYFQLLLFRLNTIFTLQKINNEDLDFIKMISIKKYILQSCSK